jgi:thiol-disulfide isomerase/thioredoxin
MKLVGSLSAAAFLFVVVAAGAQPALRGDPTRSQSAEPVRQQPGVTVRFVKNPAPVPSLTVRDLEGRSITSASWRGKVTLVNFWATWCGPCRAEIPDLIALQAKYRDHLQIVGVSVDEAPPDVVKRFVEANHMNYPVVMATSELRAAFPGVFALPTTFVLDAQVRAVQRHVGLLNPIVYEQEVQVLAGLLKARVEEVEDTGQVLLANAAQATSIPGVSLAGLTPPQKRTALERLNHDKCTCGCGLTLAQCRINDPGCDVSLPLARKLVEQIRAAR